MAAHLDAIGNVCGRYEGDRPGVALPDAGVALRYRARRRQMGWAAWADHGDCLRRRLNRRGVRLPFAIEVAGFADEEGVRFPPRCSAAGRSPERSTRACWARAGATAFRCGSHGPVRAGPGRIGAAARARRTCMPMSNCISSRVRCWSRHNFRSAWSRRSLAPRGSPLTSPAWPVMPARCRWCCGATRWRARPNASSRSRSSAGRLDAAWSAPSVPSMRCRARPTSFQERVSFTSTFARPRTPPQARGRRDRAADRGYREAPRARRCRSTSPTKTARCPARHG